VSESRPIEMAFDKPFYPVLPEMLDDDDDDIVREVKLLSLVTAHEEQERRERLNRELNLAGKPSDPNLRSSVTLQESSSLPELVAVARVDSSSGMVEGSAAKAAIYSQIARPRPHPGRSQCAEAGVSSMPRQGAGAGVPSDTAAPPPLPAMPPNARSRMQADLIRIPSPPQNVQRNRKEVAVRPLDTSANRSQSLSPPFHRTNFTSYSVLEDIPGRQLTASGSSDDAPLICLSPTTRPERIDTLDLNSLDPLRSPLSGLRNSPLTKTISDPASQNLHRPSADPKVLPYRSSPIPSTLDVSHWPPSTFIAGNDAASVHPVVYGFMPWVTNDLSSPLSPGFPVTWIRDSAGNTTAGGAAAMETAGRSANLGSVASSSSVGSDLMDFWTDDRSRQLDPVYMDLADFDPLYNVDNKAWNFEQRFDSEELFGKPGSVPSHSRATRPHAPERPAAPLPDVVAQSSVSRLASVDELQDPFSVQDLMVSLEKKRQKHALDQETQELTVINRQRSQPTDNATPSKRQVLLLFLFYYYVPISIMQS